VARVRVLASRNDLEGAVVVGRTIPDDTMRALALGVAAASAKAPELSVRAAELMREALMTLRLSPAITGHFLLRRSPERNEVLPRAAQLLPPGELAAWARSHRTPNEQADALRAVAAALPPGDDVQLNVHQIDGEAAYPFTMAERDSLLSSLRTAWRALPGAAHDSVRSDVMTVHLFVHPQSFAALRDTTGLAGIDFNALSVFGSEAAFRAILAVTESDSVRDAAYTGIVELHRLRPGVDRFSLVDSITSPTLRARALQVVLASGPVGEKRQLVLAKLSAAMADRALALADSVRPPLSHAIRAAALSVSAPAEQVHAALDELAASIRGADSATVHQAANAALIAARRLAVRGDLAAAVRASVRAAELLPPHLRFQAWQAPLTRPAAGPADDAFVDQVWRASADLPGAIRDTLRHYALDQVVWDQPDAALERLADLEDPALRDAVRMRIAQMPDSDPAFADSATAAFETEPFREAALRHRASQVARSGNYDAARTVVDSIRTPLLRAAALADLAGAHWHAGEAEAAGSTLREALDIIDSGDVGAADGALRQEIFSSAINARRTAVLLDWATSRPDAHSRLAALMYIAWLSASFVR
jgi:hypothetical protein